MSSPSLFGEESVSASSLPAETAADSSSRPSGSFGGQTQSLYRKYRPRSFDADDLVGQEHVVRTLRNAVALDRVAHAYLFCGPRGTGKTTTARLLAKAVNCLNPDPYNRPCNACSACIAINTGATTDVIEIDAASNRGIDDIRELRERVKYAPTQLKTKFYIIDEAHQITGAAANAFLKTLEEPPPHTKFILATTDPEELLATIVSRCQRFDFRRINLEAMISRLKTVASEEHLAVEDEAFPVIARHAGGSLRDALGLLDQLAVYSEGDHEPRPIDAAAVRSLLGISRNDRIERLASALAERDIATALRQVNEAVEAGEDPRQLNRQLVAYLRLLMHQRAGSAPDADDQAMTLAARFELSRLAELARLFSEIDYKIRHSSYAHLPFEVALVEGMLDRESPAPQITRSAPQPVSQEPPMLDYGSTEDEIPVRQPTTSLADRIRGTGGSRRPTPPPASPSQTNEEPPAPERPRRSTAAPVGGSDPQVEQLIDLWPQVRRQVKEKDRRAEALLQSIDPVAVRGDEIILAAAYPFHRDRMNSETLRQLVNGELSRVLGRTVITNCVLRGEEGGLPRSSSPNSGAPAAPREAAVPEPTVDEIADDERRVNAVKNIFDGEEIP
jgi:DNA polymerase-3 subunit gamma/tau